MKKLIAFCVVSLPVLFTVLAISFLIIERKSNELSLKPSITKTRNFQEPTRSATLSTSIKVEENVIGSKITNANFLVITSKGNELLVLVNKKIRLSDKFIPTGLTTLEPSFVGGGGHLLRVEAAENLYRLLSDSKSQGLNLTIVSAYRSYQHQVSVFNSWVASAGLASAESFSARPGHSQHQLGTAVDFGVANKTNFSESFGVTAEGIWLANNASKYGFVISYPKGKEAITGYSYEPWHYRYIGVDNAAQMTNSSLILEEYLQKFGTW